MPDKQDGFLLGRLVVEEHSNEAYSFVLPKRNTPGFPFLLHRLHMALNICGVLRPHGGIQGAKISQTASAQRIRVSLQCFLVHEQHIFARIYLCFVSCGHEVPE